MGTHWLQRNLTTFGIPVKTNKQKGNIRNPVRFTDIGVIQMKESVLENEEERQAAIDKLEHEISLLRQRIKEKELSAVQEFQEVCKFLNQFSYEDRIISYSS